MLNPGSVGCPAHVDPTPPAPHVSEAGSPLARHAIVGIAEGLAGCGMIALRCDHEAAAAQAEAAARPAWAHALRTALLPREDRCGQRGVLPFGSRLHRDPGPHGATAPGPRVAASAPVQGVKARSADADRPPTGGTQQRVNLRSLKATQG